MNIDVKSWFKCQARVQVTPEQLQKTPYQNSRDLDLELEATTVANEFGSGMLRHFGGLQSLLSPPAHVLSSSPCSQDSVEW